MAVRIPIITTFDKKGVNNAISNLDNLSRSAGKALGAVGAAVGGGLALSVREFGKFDAAMNQSIAIMGDVSDSMRGEMSDAAREVAKNTTFSAEQAAESFFFLASAGLSAEQSVGAMPQVAAFAQAGMFDMATATDLATDAQSALGLVSEDTEENLANLTRVTDVFVKANTLANTSVEQLATALTTKAGNALKTVGKDVEEGAAALAVFADQGIKGERAGTLLTNTIFGLTDIMKKAPEEAERLGIEVFNAAGEMNSFADISEDLTAALSSMTKEQQIATLDSLGFTKQAREGTLALLGQAESLRTYESELKSAGGTAQQVADNQLDTFNAKLSLLGSAVADVAIDVGAQLVPTIERLIPVIEELLPKIGDELVKAVNDVDFEALLNGIADFIRFVSENIDKIDDLIVILAGLTLGIGGFTTAIKVATTAAQIFGITLTKALGPIGLVGAAIGLLVTGLAALAMQNKDTRTEQDKLEDELRKTEDRLYHYRVEQAKSTNTSKLYESTIKELEERQRRLKNEFKETTGEVYQNSTALLYSSNQHGAVRDGQFKTISSTEDLTIEFHENSDSIRINNELLISNATLQEAQQRHVTASRMGRHKYTKTLMDQIEIVREENRLLLETGSRYADVGDAVVNTSGNLTYNTEQVDYSSTAYEGLSSAQIGAIESTQGLTTEVAALNGVMADGQQANSEFLDLMKGIEQTNLGPSVGDATRELQGMITELARADELIRQDGGLFEFMQGDARVMAQFDEAGNLLKSYTDSARGTQDAFLEGSLNANRVTNDLNALYKSLGITSKGDISDAQETIFGGSFQQGINQLTGQTQFVNPDTGATRLLSNASAEVTSKLENQGFVIDEAASKTSKSNEELKTAIESLSSGVEEQGLVPFAKGGIVTRPTRALIGEAGPEAVIPLDQMEKSKGKTNVNITINAGVGTDPVSVGRAVVDAIKRYETVNGKVFVSA